MVEKTFSVMGKNKSLTNMFVLFAYGKAHNYEPMCTPESLFVTI